MKLAILLIAIFLIVILIGLLPLRFRVQYRKKEKDDFISLTWQVLPGFWGITAEIPFLKISTAKVWPVFKMIAQLEGEKGRPLAEKEKKVTIDEHRLKTLIGKLPAIINRLGELKILGKWFLGKITLREFSWCTEIGTGEAAKTGILVGVIWSLKSMIYGYLHTMAGKVINNPQISVCPDFQNQKAFCNMICIFDISCGHIIIGGFKTISILFLIKRGGDKL
ncbi:MAG: DUF2953 domain-containing protein [Dehalobacterium sp.]